ncbi:MAG: hypothetical protein ACRD8O_01575, partial [Bryobacteraceae bacterium]
MQVSTLQLTTHHDLPATDAYLERFLKEKVLQRIRAIDARYREGGLRALDSASDPLVAIGVETGSGAVTKNSYGVLNLSWRARENSGWAGAVRAEVAEIRKKIEEVHGTRLRYLIWAGMGGSIEDKSMYNAAGLLRSNPRCYALDSTDPSKLKCILEDIGRRSGERLPAILKSTLVVGMAMGMTSYEPVVNLEKLYNLYQKYKIDSHPNFVYMTLPGSLLDQFGSSRGYRKIELQLDGENTTAGRHSGPLTRGSLYPLALAGVNLERWLDSTFLPDEEIHTAWHLASFIHAQGEAGRDKLTLMLPKPWVGAALWTKQDFEESLGKSESIGLKVVIGERIRLANYRPIKDPHQDRAFLAFRFKGAAHPEAKKIEALRRAGYPMAVVNAPAGALLSRYMQFIHYTVCGLGYLRRMNFVTQPSVELYKSIAGRVYSAALKSGGVENTKEWKALSRSQSSTWRGAVTLYHNSERVEASTEAPAIYASIVKQLAGPREVEYAELTYFGDTRYNPRGRRMRTLLRRAAERLFRARLKMPVDLYEGPAMNHSYHEMIIGHGRCFSTVLFSEKQEQLASSGYTAEYHRAQFLA